MATEQVRMKGLNWTRVARKGKPTVWYFYAWRGGPLIMRGEGPTRPALTPAAVAAFHEAREAANLAPADTLDRLAQDWRASPEWRALAPDTRRQWAYRLDAITDHFGQAELEAFEERGMKAEIMKWRKGMADQPRKADYHVTVLRALLRWGVLHGRLSLNIAQGIPALYKGGKRAAIIWTAEDRAAFAKSERAEVVRAVEFACLTGFRRADLIAVPWEAVGDHQIVWRTSKSGKRALVTMPLYPALSAFLADIRPENATGPIMRDANGKRWHRDTLSHLVAAERASLGLGDLHLHDCRGTAVTELAPFLTAQQIADLFGWTVGSVADIIRQYVDPEANVRAIGAAISKRVSKSRV